MRLQSDSTEWWLFPKALRRECLLAAGQSGHLHVLKWLHDLKEYNFAHQWDVIYKMDRQDLYKLWKYAVTNRDLPYLEWLEKQRLQHASDSTMTTYFGKDKKDELINIIAQYNPHKGNAKIRDILSDS